MFDDGSKLLQSPSRCINEKADFPRAYSIGMPVHHRHRVQYQKQDKLSKFNDSSNSWYDQTTMVQDWNTLWVVEGNWEVLEMVWKNVDKRKRRVHNLTTVYGINNLLACGRADEKLAF